MPQYKTFSACFQAPQIKSKKKKKQTEQHVFETEWLCNWNAGREIDERERGAVVQYSE